MDSSIEFRVVFRLCCETLQVGEKNVEEDRQGRSSGIVQFYFTLCPFRVLGYVVFVS